MIYYAANITRITGVLDIYAMFIISSLRLNDAFSSVI